MIDSSTATLRVTSQASIANGIFYSWETTEVQEKSLFRLEFDSALPLNTGCIIEILFPTDLVLTNSELTLVEGMGLFGAKRAMTYSIDTSKNSVTITDGCTSYWEAGLTGVIDFSLI